VLRRTGGGVLSSRSLRVGTRVSAALALLAVMLSTGGPASAPGAPRAVLKVLQINLCNSGKAACYRQGKSIPEAMKLIGRISPDIVTVNEICERDVRALAEALGNTGNVLFAPAWNQQGLDHVRCTNGDKYGVGLLLKASQSIDGSTVGIYEHQDGATEQRAYGCAWTNHAEGRFYACATHLAVADATAMAQCRELMDRRLPDFRSSIRADAPVEGDAPAVVGGDFNVTHSPGSAYDIQDCVPDGYFRKGDGDVQHVIAEDDFVFDGSRSYPMSYTDHPGWLVRLRAPWPADVAAAR
jgi:endonuclease/exonuclease/phosphatase family metal-dependent hydrolase